MWGGAGFTMQGDACRKCVNNHVDETEMSNHSEEETSDHVDQQSCEGKAVAKQLFTTDRCSVTCQRTHRTGDSNVKRDEKLIHVDCWAKQG